MVDEILKLGDIKNWSPEVEKPITENWMKEERFRFNKNAKKIYSVDTPPPYVNSPIHMGHAVTYSFMDMFVRYRRMKGCEVIFPLGLDRNGLPIEVGAEKKYRVSPFKTTREEFLKYCEKLLEESSVESIDSFGKLGISFTSYEEGEHIGAVYKTDSPEYRALTQKTFVELYKKGLIYEDTRINNWDPKLQTTISDSEIDYEDIASTFNDVKWKVKETGEEIIIATTRPELICTCGMVIFNPEDERYKHLDGKTAISPIFGEEVEIKSHNLADPEKGSGLVMMCSAGDLSDIQFFREQGLKPRIAINKDGTMNENAGFLEGLKVKDARRKIIETLKEKGLVVKQEKILHRTPISERSKVEIEFIEMPEFYLKQLEFKEEIRKLSRKINFYPEDSRKILDSWIDSVSIDWPISRRRYYATSVPLWYSGDLVAVPTGGEYYQPWKESPPENSEVYKGGKKVGVVKDFIGKEWVGETRVLDTWVDSSISELFITKYGSDEEFFKKAFPLSLRPQGKEIVRTWLYYTLLRGYLETGEQAFKDVWVHQHIVDDKGKKMSKSVGNIISPQELLKEYGGEAIRLWAATEGDLSKQDLNCSREKIKAELKTINKILNLSKFILQFGKPDADFDSEKLCEIDKLYIDYIDDIVKFCDESYGKYDFYHPALRLRKFIWDDFSSHYLEIVKNRAYNQEGLFSEEESNSAKYTLNHILEKLLYLIYPIIPQVSSVVGEAVGIDLLGSNFPETSDGESDLNLVDKIMEFNSLVWKAKKEKGISLRAGIEGIEIPLELGRFEKDLRAAHKI